MDVGEKLQQMLDNYGLSAYKLSKESGLSESTIANILSGKNIPSINTDGLF